MGDKSGIEWTDATWNPTVGCSVITPGCTNCYAMRMAARLESMGGGTGAKYKALTTPGKAGPVWNGTVRLDDAALTQPLRWRRPRRIFVNSMSDLFHDGLSDAQIDRVFAVMMIARRHTFQVLTKRSDRMRAYINGLQDDWRNRLLRAALNVLQAYAFEGGESWPWPLSNVWLGVSVEDQRRADLRVPDLLATPAAVRFVSCEPLLGPVDLSDIVNVIGPGDTWHIDALDHIEAALCRDEPGGLPALDWVIAGGESGPKARPMDPDWARSLRDQCAGTGTAFLFKQWGRKSAGRELDGRTWDEYPKA